VLGPEHLGRRVVVRRVLDRSGERPVLGDVLGRLTAASETEITVLTKSGAVAVRTKDITAAKPVPEQRRLSATEALELAAAAGWPAADASRLGDWWLRATEGWTRRGNSALPIGEPGLPLDEAIEAIVSWYHDRGLPPAIVVPLPLRAGLDAELARRGWAAEPATVVMTTSVEELRAVPRRSDPISFDPTPAPAWLAVAASRKTFLPAVAMAVLTGPAEVRFPIVYGVGGEPLATARGTVADEDRRWLGLSLIETAPRVRRQGYAQHVMGALADWAAGLGARDVYLQVLTSNTTAIALYERLGFTVHHSYVSRVLPAAPTA
jgi:RimJ/RimL family protein N-acetyltransferase